ncbi:MAG: class I SAM-dependent DNA methyltransferase, partial [Chloroflexi bacterium]|nr:class I SAM-dependent DNA methyltransferase [Chloroflexota bacterium]
MPILNRDDAAEVRDSFDQFFEAEADERPGILRGLFAEILDFERVDSRLALAPARERAGIELPDAAWRIAHLNGVDVLYVALSDTERVRKSEVVAVAKQVRDDLGEDMLLLFSNAATSQLHWIYPDFGSGANPTLKRMVVERDLPRRTVVQQISNIYWRYGELGNLLDSIKEAFDVEPVTKEFFKQYKTLFEAAEEKIEGFAATDQGREERKQFVQTLFNRLMFVYFLSRKGWLRYEGETDYLNALWNAYAEHPDHDNFYRNRLTYLFFEGLNNPESRDVRRGVDFLIGDVPFLNGGLFEESELDQLDGVHVPDDAVRPLMTELFDKFNFTVMESTPFDIEVAVDPEMLGKVFEELVTGRHASGAYYTPRPVVSFMCREALIGYLGSHAREVSDEALRRLVEDDDASQIPRAAAPAIGAALDSVSVVDPACGSGAYLVGMMQELLELYGALYSERLLDDPKSLYELKLHIIERNLHGVDLDPFAVNIAMLRLWLSLAIEFEGDRPKPLPNLDFKIVQGDSLL